MRAVHSNQNNYRKPLLLNKNWYAYVPSKTERLAADPANLRDLWGLEDIVIVSAIDRTDSVNNILYDLLVHSSYKKIIEAAESTNQTVKIISGSEANEALDKKIPASILSGNTNTSGEPTPNILDPLMELLGGIEGEKSSPANGDKKND